MKRAILAFAIVLCSSSPGAADLNVSASQDSSRVRLNWGVQIPMRDNIQLNATLYTAVNQAAPAPCIFTLTPYISDSYHERGTYFAARGYPFVVVDVRGRGNSGGVFRPFIQEAHDGYDIVEWLAHQPYCNGKVAMWGGSYGGYDQWATAKEYPPHLATIIPVAAPYLGVDFPMRNNIFYPYVAQWLMYTSGRTSQTKIFNDDAFWSALYREWFESGHAFRDIDAVLGDPSAVLQEWLSHPQPDQYWDAYNPTATQYAALQIPILTITASYDDDQPGAMEHYKEYMVNASPEARARHYLIIGPWDHAGTRTPSAEVGGLKLGPASLVDLPRLHVEWYAWTMQGGPKPEFLKKRVAYYVTAAEQWRYADTLEGVTARSDAYFLTSTQNPTDVFTAGSLALSQGKAGPDHYRYDPGDVKGPEVQAEAHIDAGSLTDQSVTLSLSGKELVYQSAPFNSDAELYASVYDIGLDGGSVRLSTDALRARYREGVRAPSLVETRDPLRYEFNRFPFVSRLIQKGHRLRLVIAPMGRLIQAIFAEKNYNSGGEVARESVRDAAPVAVTLYHDRRHPSALYVPVGQPTTKQESSARSVSLKFP